MKTVEDQVDYVAYLAKKNIYLATASNNRGNEPLTIFRVATLVDIIDTIDAKETKFYGAADIAEQFGIDRGQAYSYYKVLADVGLLDTYERGSKAFKTDLNFKQVGPLVIFPTGKMNSTSRILFSPRMSYRKTCAALHDIIDKRICDLVYEKEYPNICWTLIGKRLYHDKIEYCANNDRASTDLKKFFFSLCCVKAIPNFNDLDLDVDSFWQKVTPSYFYAGRCIAAENDTHVPEWRSINNRFFARYVRPIDRAKYIAEVSWWKEDSFPKSPEPRIIRYVPDPAPTPIPDKLKSPLANAFLKHGAGVMLTTAMKDAAAKIDTPVKNDPAVKQVEAEPAQTNITVTINEEPNATNTNPIEVKEENKMSKKDRISEVCASDLKASIKVALIKSILAGKEVEDDAESVAIVNNVAILSTMAVDDDKFAALVNTIIPKD